jgi:hypothetical protein
MSISSRFDVGEARRGPNEVDPDVWRLNGGDAGQIDWLDDLLVIAAPEPTLHKVETALATMSSEP